MREDRPSLTAAAVSFARGVGASGEVPDPYARRLLPAPISTVLAAYGHAGPARWPLRLALRGLSLGLVDHIALRTAAIDRAVAEGVAAGCSQVVILGAGLDARAWRMDALRDVEVFEVDHPATQAYKRRRAPTTTGRRRRVVFVPVNFERQRVGQELATAGHDATRPTVWIWEGVTMYLPRLSLVASLGEIASRSAPASRLAVTYMLPERLPAAPQLEKAVAQFFDLLAEPLVGAVPPDEMQGLVVGAGFHVLSDGDNRDWARAQGNGAAPAPLYRAERLLVAACQR